MLEAWDSRHQTNLSVASYVELYGPRSDSRYRPTFRPKLRCLVCSGTLHTVHETSQSAQWVHDPNPARKCAAKASNRILDGLPKALEESSDDAKALRASFFRHWGGHWSRARKLCGNATIESFVAFVAEADRVELWGRTGVREGIIPYIFLTSREFPSIEHRVSPAGRTWLRFAFDWRIESLSDLDSCKDGAPQFIRLTFKAPPHGEPKFDSLIRQEPIAMNTTFIYMPADGISGSDVAAMGEAFPDELGTCLAA